MANAVNSPDGVNALNAIKNVDTRKQAVYTSVDDALAGIPSTKRKEGLNIDLLLNDIWITYTFQGGILDEHFIPKIHFPALEINSTVNKYASLFRLDKELDINTSLLTVRSLSETLTTVKGVNFPTGTLVSNVQELLITEESTLFYGLVEVNSLKALAKITCNEALVPTRSYLKFDTSENGSDVKAGSAANNWAIVNNVGTIQIDSLYGSGFFIEIHNENATINSASAIYGQLRITKGKITKLFVLELNVALESFDVTDDIEIGEFSYLYITDTDELPNVTGNRYSIYSKTLSPAKFVGNIETLGKLIGNGEDITGIKSGQIDDTLSSVHKFVTQDEKNKLASLENSKFLGQYSSLTALNGAHASPNPAGSYADVDAGAGNGVTRYVWDVTDDEFQTQAGTSTAISDAQVKTQYENNANTNAYTDLEQNKLDEIETDADVTDTDNVRAAHALMDDEIVNLAEVKAFNSAEYADALGSDDNYVTDAEKVVIENTAGANSGDNADNSQYSGLDASKIDKNVAITPGTYIKITYDADGLVTGGADARTNEIEDITDKRYVNDAQRNAILHDNRNALDLVAGENTGDEDLTPYAKHNEVQSYTKQQYFARTNLTNASNSIDWNLNDNQVAHVTMDASATLNNPTGGTLKDGAIYMLAVTQINDGDFDLSYGTLYEFGIDEAPVLTNIDGRTDVLTFISNGNRMFFTGIKKGFEHYYNPE